MRHPGFRSTKRALTAGAFVALLVVVTLSAVGQNVSQDPPLYRSNTNSSIEGAQPGVRLTDPAQKYLPGDQPIDFSINYKCTTTAGNPGTADSLQPLSTNPDRQCTLGAPATQANTRTVSVFFNQTGGVPTTTSSVFTLSASGATVITQPWDLVFTGSRNFATGTDLKDGDVLNFFIRVATDPSSSNTATCPGGTPGASHFCFDPADTTGQSFYSLTFDRSTPTFVVNDPANANVFNVSKTEWYLYSNKNMSNFLPAITLTIVDDPLGAPIDQANTKLYRNDTDNTTRFTKTVVTPHAVSYTYDYTQGGAQSFRDGVAYKIDVDTRDTVGHRIDTRPRNNPERPALWIIMDVTAPDLDHENSQLKKQSGSGDFAALGEKLGVAVNVTDVGAGLATPKRFLTVEARLTAGPNNTTVSPWYPVAFNTTSGFHKSENITVPSTWVSGLTYAEVRVTDGALNRVTHNITGSVSVDVDKPRITPLAPLDGSVASSFAASASTTFRVRAVDPNDADEWKGPNTVDTDNIGIRPDGVTLHFKVGETGPLSTARLSPQTAINTYAATRTFNPEDTIYYFLSAKDLAGNTVYWPAAANPHVTIPADASNVNGGRYLKLEIDQVGPIIQEAVDLTYVGGGPHEFRFGIFDEGIGLDSASPRLFWRVAGSATYREVTMTATTATYNHTHGTGNATTQHAHPVFRATIPTQEDGAVIQWYVTAKDTLGNAGSLGTATAPDTTTIDITPPEVTMTAPATTNVARFNISWMGTDAGSGVKDYTLQFRVGATGQWFTVPSREQTTATSYDVCAATQRTYDFRMSVRDNALNERAFPATPQASTIVNAPSSCAAPPEVVVTQPADGATVTGDQTIAWSAVSTTFPGDLRVRIDIGQGSVFEPLLSNLENTGLVTWDSAANAQESPCFADGSYTLRVVGIDPNGLEGSGTAGPFTLQNGITDCQDRDNDGLPDQWEFLHFGNLNRGPNDDPDSDGFTNLQEAAAGTNPQDARSRPGGTATGDAAEEWDNLYLVVVAAFVGVLAVFAVGMTRRW